MNPVHPFFRFNNLIMKIFLMNSHVTLWILNKLNYLLGKDVMFCPDLALDEGHVYVVLGEGEEPVEDVQSALV